MVSLIFPGSIAELQCFLSMLCKLLILEAGFGCVFMFFYKKLPLLRYDFDSNFKMSLGGDFDKFLTGFLHFFTGTFYTFTGEIIYFFHVH